MNDVTRRVISGMSGDGFNERRSYINNNNDLNRMDNNVTFDNSLSQMRVAENKPDIKTVDTILKDNTNTQNSTDPSKLKMNVDMYQSFRRQNMNNLK